MPQATVLSDTDCRQLVADHRAGMPQHALARKYQIGPLRVGEILDQYGEPRRSRGAWLPGRPKKARPRIRPARHSAWIGARVREAREAAGMTQDTLAAWIGVTAWQVSKYESGQDRISFETMVEIADFLGAELDAFRPSRGDRLLAGMRSADARRAAA